MEERGPRAASEESEQSRHEREKKRRLSNGVSGLTYTTLDILLTTPETVLKEYVQYASEAERRFDDVRGELAF